MISASPSPMRIDPEENQVGDHIAQESQESSDDEDTHNDGVIPRQGTLIEEQAHPVDGEDLLEDHAASEQARKGEAQDRDDEGHEIGVDVAADDRFFVQAAGPGEKDVVALEDVAGQRADVEHQGAKTRKDDHRHR